ncbi:MAG: peptidoglycan-binding protein [Candidatus Omnitrophica bacterium]|nr:peptidoglycan-binding protein [Candidatus Omnitrophota bacterium]
MQREAIFAGIAVLCLSGCATTSQPSAINNLQIKVAQLENKVTQQEQDMAALKDSVNEMSGQVQNGNYDAKDKVEEPAGASRKAGKSAGAPAALGKDESKIIRVDATPAEVQKALRGAGYYQGEVDGKLGAKTKEAIRRFQKDHNLTDDGVLGKRTWQELKKYSE